jgi:hypothetical protein
MSIERASHDAQPAVPLYHANLVGTVKVPLQGSDAFHLFTPIGEKEWAQGWEPLFPSPVDDDSQPGTVFEIEHHGTRSVWVVCQCEPDRFIHYARVVLGQNAGTVIVHLADEPAGSVATVEYELTALNDAAARDLARFASHYSQFLAEWEASIAEACLRDRITDDSRRLH